MKMSEFKLNQLTTIANESCNKNKAEDLIFINNYMLNIILTFLYLIYCFFFYLFIFKPLCHEEVLNLM